MAIITEKKPIVGKLASQERCYSLLDLKPTTPTGVGVNFLLREYGLQFYAVVNGFAQHIVVSKSSWLIVPFLEPEMEDVKYIVEEGDTEPNIPTVKVNFV